MNERSTRQELIASDEIGGIADERNFPNDEADEPVSVVLEGKAREARG